MRPTMKVASRPPLPLLVLLVQAALMVGGARASSLPIESCEIGLTRLPKHTMPARYNLQLSVDPEAEHFSGQLEIVLHHHSGEPADTLRCKLAAGQPGSQAPGCSTIILHAAPSLEIESVDYRAKSAADAPETGVPQIARLCRSGDLLLVELSRVPRENISAYLLIAYRGAVQAQNNGLFRCEHQDASERANEQRAHTKHMLLTQLEPTSARELLPCFDEPEFKATFQLTVERPSNLTALSNTRPVLEVRDVSRRGLSTTLFAPTPPMSPYLLALAVGQFDHLSTGELDGSVTLGAYVPPGRTADAQIGLDQAARAYTALYGFFAGLPQQPLGKIDFVTCKSLLLNMENWGLITLEESVMMPVTGYNASSESSYASADPDQVHSSREIIVHELAHQWFGNLVTMKWWDDLWLNEGFASWMARELMDELYPGQGSSYITLLNSKHQVLEREARPVGVRPIKSGRPATSMGDEELEDSFNYLVYEKAAAVIEMLRNYIGAEPFRAGLQVYLRANQFGNTDESDLLAALALVSGVDVSDMLRSWLYQPGYPLISVRLSPDGRALELRQSRFSLAKLSRRRASPRSSSSSWCPCPCSSAGSGSRLSLASNITTTANPATAATPTPDPDPCACRCPNQPSTSTAPMPSLAPTSPSPPDARQEWIVPVSMWLSDGKTRLTKQLVLLDASRQDVQLPDWFDARAPGHWLKLNANFEGLFRVSYESPELFAALRAPIETKQMPPADRLNLIEEAQGLVLAGKMSVEQFLELLAWFRLEDHDAVVGMIAQALVALRIAPDAELGEVGPHEILVDHYERSGRLREPTPGEGLLKTMVRADVLHALNSFADKNAVQDSLNLFEASAGQVPGFLRGPIYAAVAYVGSESQFKCAIDLTQRLDSALLRRKYAMRMFDATLDRPDRRLQLKQHFPRELFHAP